MTGPQRFPFARPPVQPCHPYYCETCGYALRLEMVAGKVIEVCLGCIRNRERAGMRLPPIDYHPPPWPMPERVRSSGPLTQRILAKVPRDVARACRPAALAHACGTSHQVVLRVLRRAEQAGRVQSTVDRRWYRRVA